MNQKNAKNCGRFLSALIFFNLLNGCVIDTSNVKYVDPEGRVIFDPKMAYLVIGVDSDKLLLEVIRACRGESKQTCGDIGVPSGADKGVYVVEFPVGNEPTRFVSIHFSGNVSGSPYRPPILMDKPGIYFFGVVSSRQRTDRASIEEWLGSAIMRKSRVGTVSINFKPNPELVASAKSKYPSVFKVYPILRSLGSESN